MAALSTAALITLAAASAGAAVYQGEASKKAGKQANRRQDAAQQQATAAAQAQERKSEQEANRINRKAPDLSALLLAAQKDASGAGRSTMLSGGVDPSKLKLAKSSLLGDTGGGGR